MATFLNTMIDRAKSIAEKMKRSRRESSKARKRAL